jgi:hypothetical protein
MLLPESHQPAFSFCESVAVTIPRLRSRAVLTNHANREKLCVCVCVCVLVEMRFSVNMNGSFMQRREAFFDEKTGDSSRY